MNKIFQVLSNLKHNGDEFVKGTVFEAPAAEFEALVEQGVLRIVEGVATVAEATAKLAEEAGAALEASESAPAAPQDTWAPTPETPIVPDVSGQVSGADATNTEAAAPVMARFTVLKEFEVTNPESKNFGKHAVGDVIEADPAAAQGLVNDGTLTPEAPTGDNL